jgi:CheY-like chemotaxis protein
VIEAFNADEALELLTSVMPDIIISDVQMPGSLDGLGLLASIRTRLPTLPVIITSGHFRPTGAIDDGPTLFVAKPYAVHALVSAVQNQLGKAV